jgi:hypothetical protein
VIAGLSLFLRARHCRLGRSQAPIALRMNESSAPCLVFRAFRRAAAIA